MTPTNDFSPRYTPVGQEARLASHLSRLLDESSQRLPDGVEERLRVARAQALGKARFEQRSSGVVSLGGGAIGWLAAGWWPRVFAMVPILALVAGLISIEQHHRDAQINTAVEIDSALLTDEAPLAAYRDAGFVEFLKSPAN